VPDQVTISAPSRLHFGLFSVGETVDQKFGGAGLMIHDPATIVTATKADAFEIQGTSIAACQHALQTWFEKLPPTARELLAADQLAVLGVNIKIESVPPRHCGFGSGTQLALSLAMAVIRLFELPVPGPAELAASVGRGKRSGIGSHGFFRGGFLVDRGITGHDPLAPLEFQTDFPESWSIVTIILNDVAGLSGGRERSAFDGLPPTHPTLRNELIELVRSQVIPGILSLDYELFAEGVFELGRRSGLMYSEIQKGPYNGPQVELLVNQVREFGVPAVGQSSWGPCVFAIARNDKLARDLVAFLKTKYDRDADIRITQADNRGARLISPKPQFIQKP
jgi:beta-RFAP synthase